MYLTIWTCHGIQWFFVSMSQCKTLQKISLIWKYEYITLSCDNQSCFNQMFCSVSKMQMLYIVNVCYVPVQNMVVYVDNCHFLLVHGFKHQWGGCNFPWHQLYFNTVYLNVYPLYCMSVKGWHLGFSFITVCLKILIKQNSPDNKYLYIISVVWEQSKSGPKWKKVKYLYFLQNHIFVA